MAPEKSGFLADREEVYRRDDRGQRPGNRRWRLVIVPIIAMVGMLGCWGLGAEGLAAVLHFSPAAVLSRPSSPPASSDAFFDPYKHLGHLSPFFVPTNTPESLRSGAPPGCAASRAFLVHRHGSRHSHAGELPVVQGLADYVGNNSALFANPRSDIPYAWSFLRNGWNNTLGVDDLTAPGRQQLFDHGVALRLRYPDLYTGAETSSGGGGALAVAGGEDRVIESASWFLAGYYGRAVGGGAGGDTLDSHLEVIPEDEDTVSWITPYETCAAWDERSAGNLTEQWDAVYLPPIAARVNALLSRAYPGAGFTPQHVHGMFWACAYGTAALGVGASPWCGVFEPDELLRNEYEYDLRQRGFSGYGLPGDMGPVLGSLLVSNVTEFLRGGDVEEHGGGGGGGGKGEPRSSRRLSLNFVHDKTLALGLTALGLAADDSFPPTGPVDPHRSWQTARLVPFASYMLWKRLECDGDGDRIQLILNGANYGLGPTGCSIDQYGTCEFDDFLNAKRVKAALSITHGDKKWKEVCKK